MSTESKNPARVAAGLKATLHRDNVSDEAKQHAEERLKEMGAIGSDASTTDQTGHLSNRALGGYKATLTNEATSDQAKAHARDVLERGTQENDAEHAEDSAEYVEGDTADTDEHEMRVRAGYKATLSNPRVSDEAKEHASEYLKEH
ncbi:hypothetical protein B0H11DRAFT_1986210 [Mycena galericulata]|nr:hypothetical protein B0H11DRAFT_1986210 [Mycena galericulata]